MKVNSVHDLKLFPESDLVISYISERWKQGLYSLCLVNGLPGSGKSSLCCRLSELVYLKLVGENQFQATDIVDNLLDFIKAVRSATPDKVKVIVIEEISVLFPSRRAMSGDNVDIAQILDTCRKKKIIIFANAPVWNTIDSHIRSMANVFAQTIKVYKGAELVYSKCYRLQTDPRTGKTYTHNFKRDGRDVNRMYTLKPNMEVWDEYETKKDKFLDRIYSKAEARQIQKMKKDEKLLRHLDPDKIDGLTSQELKVFDMVKIKKRTQKEVAKELGITQGRISQILAEIRGKQPIS